MKDLILNSDSLELPSWARYDNNPQLKKVNVKISYTEEHIEEFIKCKYDFIYFAEHYCYIIDPDKGKSIVVLRDYQKRLSNHLLENRFSVLLLSRQTGKSLICSLFILWYSIFHSDKASAILANKQLIAKSIFDRVKLSYENLPFWLQSGVKEWNAMSMKLENGSSIFCSATSSSAIRGVTISGVLMLDEFAFLPQNIADEFFASVFPTITASQESKVICVSTPCGLNHFATLWKKAESGRNSFKPFRIKWDEPPGRDLVWLEKMKKDMGELKVEQEILMNFLGSSKTLISANILESLDIKDPIRLTEDNLRIYSEPIEGHIYSIGVDSSKGVGGDYSVTQILDITEEIIKQVAVYSSNKIGPRNFAKLVVKFAQLYNNAYVLVENNAEGCLVADVIWNEEEYENLIDFDTGRHEIGIRATVKSKNAALNTLKEYMENRNLEIIDQNTVYELSKFIETKTGIYKGEDGENDDHVSALYWSLFIVTLPQIFDRNDLSINRKNYEESEDDAYLVYNSNSFGEEQVEENWLQ